MAPPPLPRRPALLLMSLLLLSVVFSHAARAAPAATSRGHAELREGQDKEVDGKGEATGGSTAAEEDPCGGGGGGAAAGGGDGGEEAEEECLMRRTLVAHTDYIYTQGGGHN
ncbi:unnamed protein product [Urochloa humidicola]